VLEIFHSLVKGFFFIVGGLLGIGVLFFISKALWKRTLILPPRRQEELLGGFFTLLALLLLISLLSYSPLDYSNIGHESIQNFGGVVGANVSHWLYQTSGFFALFLPLLLLIWGLNRFRSREIPFMQYFPFLRS
jgi:hypothetical protein